MNKLTIPALLLGVVMIAGAFAFMPVQEASTVHTSTATTEHSIKYITVTATCNVTDGDTDDCDDLNVNVPIGAIYSLVSGTMTVTEAGGDDATTTDVEFSACTVGGADTDGTAIILDTAGALSANSSTTVNDATSTGDTVAIGTALTDDIRCDGATVVVSNGDTVVMSLVLKINADAATVTAELDE